jgi:RimJ/RimL family protein N-acetyltransferase
MDVHGNFLFPYIAAQLRKSLIPKALMLPWYNAETRSRRVFGIARKSDKDRELVGIVGVYGYYDRSRKVKEIHYELHPSVWRLGES